MSQSDLKQEGIRRLELRRSNVSMAQKDANTVMIQDYALPDVFAAGKTIKSVPAKIFRLWTTRLIKNLDQKITMTWHGRIPARPIGGGYHGVNLL